MVEQIQNRRKQYESQLTQCRAQLAQLHQQEFALLGAMAALDEILQNPQTYGGQLSDEQLEKAPQV